MTRRTTGPKRAAENYAIRKDDVGPLCCLSPVYKIRLRDAWLAGYRSAARARRKRKP